MGKSDTVAPEPEAGDVSEPAVLPQHPEPLQPIETLRIAGVRWQAARQAKRAIDAAVAQAQKGSRPTYRGHLAELAEHARREFEAAEEALDRALSDTL